MKKGSPSPANPAVDGYFLRAKKWRAELGKLREILLERQFTEALKWGKPCYMYQGKNVVVMVPFKEHCALIFTQGVLLKDPKGILVLPGENTQAARQARFTSVEQIEKLEKVIVALVDDAIKAQENGLKVPFKKATEFEIPEELQAKLKKDPAVKKAFFALTPGRQRGYLMHFSAAKQTKTREARIEKCTPQILGGKGLNDR